MWANIVCYSRGHGTYAADGKFLVSVVQRGNTFFQIGIQVNIVLMIMVTRKLRFSDNAALKFEICVLNTSMDSRVVALSLYHINQYPAVHDLAYPVLWTLYCCSLSVVLGWTTMKALIFHLLALVLCYRVVVSQGTSESPETDCPYVDLSCPPGLPTTSETFSQNDVCKPLTDPTVAGAGMLIFGEGKEHPIAFKC